VKRLITIPTGWLEASLPPHEVSVSLSVFDEDGTLKREEEYTWFNASQLASCLVEVGVPEGDADHLAAELIAAHEEEEAGLPRGWLPTGGCLLFAVLWGLMMTGLGFLIWLVSTRVF
jgi:hypothetical protein